MSSRLPMTTARWMILGVGMPFALAAIAVTALAWVHGVTTALANTNQVGYPVSLTAPLTDGQADVTTFNSETVLAAAPGSTIKVRGYLSGAMARPFFDHRQTTDGLTLNPRCRAPIGNCSLKFTVTVPTGAPVKAGASFSDLHARSLRGTITLSDNSGDIDVSRLTGQLRLTDSFGAIQASNLSGSIQLSNNSGDIDAEGVTGNIQLTDGFGDITVRGLDAADVRCRNQSGDITLIFAKVPQRVDISNSFGDVTLELPPGPAAYRVNWSDPFGSAVIGVPQSPSSANVITVTNNSGDITVVNQPGGNPESAHPTPSSAP